MKQLHRRLRDLSTCHASNDKADKALLKDPAEIKLADAELTEKDENSRREIKVIFVEACGKYQVFGKEAQKAFLAKNVNERTN